MPEQQDNGYNMIPNIRRILYQNPSRYLFETWPQLRVAMYEDELRFKYQINYIHETSRKYNLVLFENVKECELYYEELKREPSNVEPQAKGATASTSPATSRDYGRNIVLLHGQLGTKEYKKQLQQLHSYRESARESEHV